MPISRVSESPLAPNGSASSAATATDSRLEIDGSRSRQTERPRSPFRSVLTGGVSVLMSGAEIATHVVAGPVLAAAVHDARIGATGALGGPAMPMAALGASVSPGTTLAAAGASAGGVAAASGPDPTSVEAMMQAGQASNLQLFALQEQVQQENQRFSTLSNVSRAKHDTAKAAVSNIRA
jgi:hypothetical protein